MNEFAKAGLQIKKEERERARQEKLDAVRLQRQVKEEAQFIKRTGNNAGTALEVKKVESEIRREKISAEIEHEKYLKYMKKQVANETIEAKSLLSSTV